MWFLELTRPLRFNSAEKSARLLMAFARAERSSHYDMMAAAQASPSAERRALYLRHACDEARHAAMFTARATELAPHVGGDPREQWADFEHLYMRLGEEVFLAFVHLGEVRGQARLTRYRDELAQKGDAKSRGILDAVLQDEARHVAYSEALLRALPRGERALRWARAYTLKRAWLRAGGIIARAVFVLGMSSMYLLLGPLKLLERRR